MMLEHRCCRAHRWFYSARRRCQHMLNTGSLGQSPLQLGRERHWAFQSVLKEKSKCLPRAALARVGDPDEYEVYCG